MSSAGVREGSDSLGKPETGSQSMSLSRQSLGRIGVLDMKP
jgi:hypothetical protein